MGVAAWSSGYASVAAHLEVDFSRMIPLGTDALLEAWVEEPRERKVMTRGRLLDDEGEPFAEAVGLFVVLDPERFGDVLEKVAEAMGVDPADLLSNVVAAHE
jgi:acyl-CoA thioesterase FadM